MRQIVMGAVLIGWSTWGFAFEAVIQGKRLVPQQETQTCIEIAGEYPGVRIEASEIGKTPQICFSDARRDIISLHNVTFVATGEEAVLRSSAATDTEEGDATSVGAAAAESNPGLPDVVIEFSHTFPPGPNGHIMARTKIAGFFATPTGLGVASGNHVRFAGIFSQGGVEDLIAEPFDRVVGEDIDSAIFESKAKKRYLIAGPRTLKGRLVINFAAPGHKLTLVKGATVSIDRGARFEDKLEEVEESVEMLRDVVPEEAPAEEEKGPSLEEELQL